MKPRNENAIVAALPKGLRAKDKIERRRATREPVGRVEEDGSYRTRGGGRYDPDKRQVNPGIGQSLFARKLAARRGPSGLIEDRRRRP